MIYVRGAAADYDNWEKLGANGWSFRDVFPFFLRSERNTDSHILANGWHNDTGPIAFTSNMLLNENPLALLNVDACKELGIELIDINGPQSIGTNVVQQNKEVILSGGAINSPQLLMLSGIGPLNQLSKLGIKVISDLYTNKSESDLKQSVWNKMYLPYAGRPAFYQRAVVLRPRSRGKLELISPYSFISPTIQLNYLTNAEDVQILVDGLRWHYRMGQTNAYKRIGAEIFKPLVVGCERLYELVNDYMFADMSVPSDEYLACQARSMSVSGNHLCVTCKIGAKTDYLAVVDEQLRVYGVRALRVIDASVMPVVPSANTNAATMMIAERGAQFIKHYYHI